MARDPGDDAIGLAEAKNALAARLVGRGKLREALEALNEAIRAVPTYPPSFSNRADVFEQLGMLPQAEADREHVQELIEEGYGDQIESPPEPRPAPRPPGPAGGRAGGVSGDVARGGSALVVVAGALLLVAGAIVVVAVVLNGGSGGDGGTSLQAPATATSTAAPGSTPTAVAVSPSLSAVAGAPLSVGDLQQAWEAAGIQVAAGQASSDVSGFAVAPAGLELSRGGSVLDVVVLVYPDRDSPKQDWDLVVGSAPALKDGRSLPDGTSVWWNQNVVVAVRSGSSDIVADARAAFLSLAP